MHAKTRLVSLVVHVIINGSGYGYGYGA